MAKLDLRTVTMEEIWKSTSDGYIPALLEIYNPDIKWDDPSLEQENCYLRVISDTNSVIYKGKRYLPCKFTFTLPEETGQKIGEASIVISTIDSRVISILRSIELQCTVKITAFFAKEGSKYKFYYLDSFKATLPSVTYNRSTASFKVVFKDALQVNVPAETATKDKLPSVKEDE